MMIWEKGRSEGRFFQSYGQAKGTRSHKLRRSSRSTEDYPPTLFI